MLQKDRACKSYAVLGERPLNNFETAVAPTVPALIHGPEGDKRYLNSCQAIPDIAGQETVTVVAVIAVAVNTGGSAHPLAAGVAKLTSPHRLGWLFEAQYVRACT